MEDLCVVVALAVVLHAACSIKPVVAHTAAWPVKPAVEDLHAVMALAVEHSARV